MFHLKGGFKQTNLRRFFVNNVKCEKIFTNHCIILIFTLLSFIVFEMKRAEYMM